jgi:hypothetical protein
LRLTPNSVIGYGNVMGICLAPNRLDEAKAAFDMAHLQLGRAYALLGDTAKARTSYQDFFALWKDADPDIPILKEAKAEYAKLQ